MVFDESTIRKLQQLTLVSRQVRAGVLKGERRSTKRGTSLEFADYRDYTPGDDLRRLDWNVYARLERPFIKLFEEEEDLAVHVLVDASKSMDFGTGELHKLHYALNIAAALGAIALGAGDRLTVAPLYANTASPEFGPSRGSQHLMRLLVFLGSFQPKGTTDLNQELRSYTLGAHRPGLVFILSDLFTPDTTSTGAASTGGSESTILTALTQLLSRGYEVTILHILTPDEIDPPLAGDLRLVDVETGHAQEVSIDGGLRDLYRRRLRAWQGDLGAACHKRDMRYIPIITSTPWDKVVLFEMRKAGLLK